MSGFQLAARMIVTKLLGSTEPPQGYLDEIEALNDACAEWYVLNPGARVALNLPDLRSPNRSPLLLTGNLDLADKAGMCLNDDARAFIDYIDGRTGYRATLLMLQVCVAVQKIVTEPEPS